MTTNYTSSLILFCNLRNAQAAQDCFTCINILTALYKHYLTVQKHKGSLKVQIKVRPRLCVKVMNLSSYIINDIFSVN